MILREKMPEIRGATGWINGKFTRETLLDGKPVLIHFWSVNDPGSKIAMQTINEWKEKHRARLNVAAVHVPLFKETNSIENVKNKAELLRMSQVILLDNNLEISHAFGNKAVPAYYLFDQEGQLRQYHAGDGGLDRLEKWINRTVDFQLVTQ